MKLVAKWLDRLDQICAYGAGAVIVVMMLWIFVDALLRSVFNAPILGTIELTGEYFLVFIVYLSLSYVFKENGHVSVDFLEHWYTPLMKRIFRACANLIALVVFVVLAYNNYLKGLDHFARDIRTPGPLDYPIGPSFMIITVGLLILCIRLILDTIQTIAGKRP